MDYRERKISSENGKPGEVTDRKILGALDPGQIPSGYGIVFVPPKFREPESRFAKLEYLITNNTGDVMLFIDPNLRSLSGIQLEEGRFEGFTLGMENLPPKYQEAIDKIKMPDRIQTIKSMGGTVFVHALGMGTFEDPLRVIQSSTQTAYKNIYLLVHPAVAKHAFLSNQSFTVLLNDVLYTYSPKNGVAVEVEASTIFEPPRADANAIRRDIEKNKPISSLDDDYYHFMIKHPDTGKDPVGWYREDYSLYGLKIAETGFKRVQDMLRRKK